MAQPTLEPVTERIMANVASALQGIRTDDVNQTYWHDVKKVLRVDTGYPEIKSMPACVLMITNLDVADDLDSQTHSLNVESLGLEIDGWLSETTQEEKAMQRLARDIRAALMRDPRRGGLAIHTYIRGVQYHNATESEPNSLVQIQASVEYRTRVDDLDLVLGS